MNDRSILISNGFNRFHMAAAAAEMERRGRLAALITGAYPTRRVTGWLERTGLAGNPRVRRLLDRGEAIDEKRITALFAPEAVCSLSRFFPPLFAAAHRYYGRAAVHAVRSAHKAGARLYHYRAGFGHQSVREAKRLGMIALCDHSIVHPALIEFLVANGGAFPEQPGLRPQSRFWEDVLIDIEQADHVLVNSQFVADTFAHMGWPAEKVSVIYLGVDQKFLEDVPDHAAPKGDGPLRMMFAGAFGKRKGAHVLLEALSALERQDWELHVAGPIDPEIAASYGGMLASPRFVYHGNLLRADLASTMSTMDLFAFPSLAEGSARVIFEAMACGLPILTTANAGSIVEHGRHGWLVPPGQAQALTGAIEETFVARDRLPALGAENARIVKASYTQAHYGENLEILYDNLLRDRVC